MAVSSSSSCGWASSSDSLDVDGVDFKPVSGVIIQNQQPCIPFGARCRGHVEMMWSTVCSEAPHSQFGEGAALHLYMDEWNHPTPVRRRFSFTQDVLGKPIPRGLGLALGIKA